MGRNEPVAAGAGIRRARLGAEAVWTAVAGKQSWICTDSTATQFLLNIWCGGDRFEHAEVVRHDTVLQRLFGFARMANFKALIRFCNKFNQATNAQVFDRLYRWLFGQIQVYRLTRNRPTPTVLTVKV